MTAKFLGLYTMRTGSLRHFNDTLQSICDFQVRLNLVSTYATVKVADLNLTSKLWVIVGIVFDELGLMAMQKTCSTLGFKKGFAKGPLDWIAKSRNIAALLLQKI